MARSQKMHYVAWSTVYPGCILIGLGVGTLFNKVGAGLLIGIGVGFIAVAVLYLTAKDA